MPLSLNENEIAQEWIGTVNDQVGDKLERSSYFRIPCDERRSIIIKELPDYEDLDTQLKGSKSTRHQIKANDKFLEYSDIQEAETMSKSYGRYTLFKRMIESNLPWYVQKLMPLDARSASEKTWNMYPYTKQVTINDFFKKSCRIEIDTVTQEHKFGESEAENVHNLPEDKLRKREVVIVDITDPAFGERGGYNPSSFKSTKSGRGLLEPRFWTSETNSHMPFICIYKLIVLDFKIFPIQAKVESSVADTLKEAIGKEHRRIFCSIDKWFELSLADIRKTKPVEDKQNQ